MCERARIVTLAAVRPDNAARAGLQGMLLGHQDMPAPGAMPVGLQHVPGTPGQQSFQVMMADAVGQPSRALLAAPGEVGRQALRHLWNLAAAWYGQGLAGWRRLFPASLLPNRPAPTQPCAPPHVHWLRPCQATASPLLAKKDSSICCRRGAARSPALQSRCWQAQMRMDSLQALALRAS